MNAVSQQVNKAELEEYFIIKKTAPLPPKINLLFSILEKVIQSPNECSHIGKQSNKAFLYTFSKLARDQQVRFMNQCIKHTAKCLLKKQDEVIPHRNQIRNIETTVEVYSTYLKIPMWYQYNFKLDKNKKTVVLTSKKKTQILNLENYLVRRSKKFKNCIVLQGINDGSLTEYKKYVLSFKGGLGEEIYEEIFQTVIDIKQAELEGLIKHNEEETKNSYSGENTSMAFLSPKNINQFLNFKECTIKYLLAGKFQFKQISLESRKEFKIQQSQKNQKLFKLEGTLQMNAKEAKSLLLQNFGNLKNKIVISRQILESYSGKYWAVYEKYLFANKIQQLITIKEQNLSDQEDVLFVKGMDNIMVKNFLQFLLVKIKQTTQKQSKVVIICSIILGDVITPEKVKWLMFSLYQNCKPSMGKNLVTNNSLNMIKQEQTYNKEITKVKDQIHVPNQNYAPEQIEEQFHTVCGYDFPQEQYMEFVEGEGDFAVQPKPDQPGRKISAQHLQPKLTINYLKHKYQTSPLLNFDKALHMMTEHYLFKDWERRKDGGVLCKNQDIVNNQKRLFKELISRMGSNILKKGTGVLNISIPVIVFKKQSHLESIARDFCYAPLIFENVTDSLERVKFASILAISVGTLGISMEKPFNPLLGETFQGWIGGCPIYLQQISHHPPIGSYYFVGRGYKIHGQIEPRISFGMNNVKGFSEKPNYLIYDDGTEIEMVYGKMIIHGLLFGERQFNFEDKIYAFDKKNHIFSQIFYGPRKKGMLSKPSEPWDYCYGTIFQVKQQFVEVFNSSSPRIYPSKEFIVKELSSFEGIWNEIIRFDGVQYINFKTDLPCAVENQQFPIPSNSHHRQDLVKLIEGDLEASQEQKQIIEQIQRRDRRLREGHKHTEDHENKIKVKKAFTK